MNRYNVMEKYVSMYRNGGEKARNSKLAKKNVERG